MSHPFHRVHLSVVVERARGQYLQQLQTAALPTRQGVLVPGLAAPLQTLVDPLSPREQEVLALLAAGSSAPGMRRFCFEIMKL